MNPRIVAKSGPLKGSVLSLTEGFIVIGTDPDSTDICLEGDEQVEDQHCYLWIESDGQVRLTNEAESEDHVVLINGKEEWDAQLAHGDIIQIGSSTFIYYVEDEEAAPAPASGSLRFG